MTRPDPATAASLRLAAAGGLDPAADPAAAVAAAAACLAAAAAHGAHLLVLPQGFLSGGGTALLSDAQAPRELAAAARRHRVAVACGYLERCSGRLHDAALFVDGRGCALANYRRIHLDEAGPGGDEAGPGGAAIAPGHWLNQVAFGGDRLGLLIGADLEAPEASRALALAGATVLLLAADLRGRRADMAEALLRVRALENGCAIACATLGPAPARIVGADGAVLAEASDGLAVADVPTERPAEAARRLAARRPTLYRRLVAEAAHGSKEAPRA